MRVIALETSERIGSVALLEAHEKETNVLHSKVLPPDQRSAQSLLPVVNQLLQEATWQASSLELICVTTGPGSFTGLRIGATVAKTAPAHGIASRICHNDPVIFHNISQNIHVGRYHALSVIKDHNFPTSFDITAQTSQGIIMAMKHKQYPIFGLQFHPESILTEYGLKMIENFIDIC